MAPGPSKINCNGIFGYWRPKWATKEFSAISRTWGEKCVHADGTVPKLSGQNHPFGKALQKIYVAHLDPQYPKIPLELIFDLFWGPGAVFQRKKPKNNNFKV